MSNQKLAQLAAALSADARVMLAKCSAAEKVCGQGRERITLEEQRASLVRVRNQRAALDELVAAGLVEWRPGWRPTDAGRCALGLLGDSDTTAASSPPSKSGV